jgi:hypothetical protein
MASVCIQRTVALALALFLPVFAQAQTASLSGRVLDPSGAVVSDAAVTLTRVSTESGRTAKTNGSGLYIVPFVQPGVHRLQVAAAGFKGFTQRDIVIETGQNATIEVRLEIGQQNDTITVDGSGPTANSTDGTVGTQVDQRFVEALPMNGRTLQTLIGLTPGVVYTASSVLEQGQFSVNGQRANANYFTVDGVSANFGISPTTELGQTGSGAVPALGASGGTNTLVSVDAIEEFRVQTSTFAPEFGRQPGAQISVATRSGGNDWHGTAFWYFRNDKLDANDWFGNRDGIPRQKLRQNDLGVTLGGPLRRKKTFAFFSHETLRLRVPRVVVQPVPSAAIRAATPVALQPYINAYPVANGPELTGGFATFSGGYSETSDLDATGLRVDHHVGSRWSAFVRYNHAPSSALQRANSLNAANVVSDTDVATRTLTGGLTGILSSLAVNDLRLNYSRATARSSSRMDSVGGAVPLPDPAMFPSFTNREEGLFQFQIQGGRNLVAGSETANAQNQLNLTDNLSVNAGTHQMKIGLDYRELLPSLNPRDYQQTIQFTNLGTARGGVRSGQPAAVLLISARPSALRYTNFSAYAQDTWRATKRLTVTYGLRWDYNSPPKGRNGTAFSTFRDKNGSYGDLASLALVSNVELFDAPRANFAPRVGAAYSLREKRNWVTILRGGYGLFYDLGTGSYNPSLNPLPGSAQSAPTQYPLPESMLTPPPQTVNAPYGTVAAADPDLRLPRIHQFNVAFERRGVGSPVAAHRAAPQSERCVYQLACDYQLRHIQLPRLASAILAPPVARVASARLVQLVPFARYTVERLLLQSSDHRVRVGLQPGSRLVGLRHPPRAHGRGDVLAHDSPLAPCGVRCSARLVHRRHYSRAIRGAPHGLLGPQHRLWHVRIPAQRSAWATNVP